MDEVTRKQLRGYAEVLEDAERMGASEDEPEGVRYIQMSDTLARALAAFLRELAGEDDGGGDSDQRAG